MTTLAFDQDDLPEIGQTRPVWLMTLADLALLLVGFFVFVQASQSLDKTMLAKGMREGFGVHSAADPALSAASAAPAIPAIPAEPMAVSAGAMSGFAPGSATAPESPDALIVWARDATRDPRVTLRISGAVDGTPADVDPVTGSGAVLAADRARTVAALLLVAHAVPADHLTIVSSARPGRRAVTVSTGFASTGLPGRRQ